MWRFHEKRRAAHSSDHQLARFFFALRAETMAAITDRSNPLTASDEPKTAATSGSSTTALLSGFMRAANRFGRDFE
jgi:hypothetical protein